MDEPTKMWVDCDPKKDEVCMFFTREFEGRRIVIVPKNSLELTETPTTYILTFKEDPLKP